MRSILDQPSSARGPGRIVTLVESALETKTNTMTRMRDIDPMIIRAQCAADAVWMAREIVRAKIEASLKFTVREPDGCRRAAEEWKAKLNAARSVADIMIVEAPLRPAFSPARLWHVVSAGFSGSQMKNILA